jgi:glycosyltransferase involved in cell wall biosynthesis
VTLVVHVVPYFPPHVGGMENVAKTIAESLARHGPVEVLTSTSGAAREPRVERSENLVVRRLRTLEFAHLPFMPSLLFHLLRLPRNATVHVHVAQAFVPELVWLASAVRRRAYVAHFHLDVDPSGRLGPVFVAYKNLVLGGVLRAAARVIAVSPDQPAFLRRTYGLPEDRIVLIPNGVAPQFFAEPRAAAPAGRPFRLLFVGRLAPQKNVPLLLRAVASVSSPVELVIVGDGEERPMLEQLARSLGLGNVRMVGALAGDELVRWYRWADALVLTSRKESTGLVILEAMAAGVPVVAAEADGVVDTVGDDGLLAAPEPAALAAAVERLAADPELWVELARRGHDRARERPWGPRLELLRKVYAEVGP